MRPAPFRAARGGAVALVGLVLAAAGHALAGGLDGVGVVSLLPAVGVVAGCVLASSRAWTVARVVAALVAMQVVVHGTAWLAAGGGQVDPRLAGLATRTGAHQHAAAAAPTPGMLAAHLGAVLVAALLLARIDEVVLRLWQLGRAVLGARPARLVPGPAPRPLPVVAPRGRARARALLVSPRRGPPRVVAPC